MKSCVKLGSRKSPLALWQTQYVKKKILSFFPSQEVKIISYMSSGDKIKNQPLYKLGGKGLFVKELETALEKKEIDIGVHSVKDIPGKIKNCFIIPIVLERENPLDAFLSDKYSSLQALPLGATIGTSSPRRKSQLLFFRKDLNIVDLRGNISTRILALKEKKLDAILLAVAGLKRMKLDSYIRQIIPLKLMLPAAGQGIIGLEYLKEQEKELEFLYKLNHQESYLQFLAERSFLKKLDGDCHLPVAAYASIYKEKLTLSAFVGDLKGEKTLKSKITGDLKEASFLGEELANELLKKGAKKLLFEND